MPFHEPHLEGIVLPELLNKRIDIGNPCRIGDEYESAWRGFGHHKRSGTIIGGLKYRPYLCGGGPVGGGTGGLVQEEKQGELAGLLVDVHHRVPAHRLLAATLRIREPAAQVLALLRVDLCT
ncbi:hypothetical protein CFL01nite_13960 [Corynebacterium flavescens]|uniref:Uncharacterized protein n=1 Tax=Corynebacterium flavescens TaxID=28028 RepID=A0AB73B7J4_CORFL|nr:hypothetical protein [Corynebacterium flavescens]GEB97901.1 hypothetical protein CFL01nite_13960 [Corynebacterium flavescens]